MKTLRDQLSKQNINIDQSNPAAQLSDQEIAAVSGGAYEENAAVEWFAKAVIVIKF